MVAGPVRLRRLLPRLLLTVEGSPIDWQSNYIFSYVFSLSLSHSPHPGLKCFDGYKSSSCIIATSLGGSICIYDTPYLSIRVFDLIGLLYGNSFSGFLFRFLLHRSLHLPLSPPTLSCLICLPQSNIYIDSIYLVLLYTSSSSPTQTHLPEYIQSNLFLSFPNCFLFLRLDRLARVNFIFFHPDCACLKYTSLKRKVMSDFVFIYTLKLASLIYSNNYPLFIECCKANIVI